MIELGRLSVSWRGWPRGAMPWLGWDRFGTKATSEYRRVLIGPVRVDWWTVP